SLMNASELADRVGFTDEADQLLMGALPRGRGRLLPALLLAERYADRGRASEAESLFSSALARAPGLVATAAVQGSAAGRDMASRLRPESRSSRNRDLAAHELPSEEEAAETLRSLSVVAPENADYSVWLDRAVAHMTLGETRQARHSLAVARDLGDETNSAFALASAHYYEAAGQEGMAIKALERAVNIRGAQAAYSLFVYSRPTLPGELLPDLAMLERTADDLLAYRELARLYANQGRMGDADRVERDAEVLARLLEGDGSD
ncbi:MAG TPA: hypothetical protein VHS06_04370, partial [Chloroflexota bacterium]|nr:hypothetical protein [Chloroflexota bacterium]